MEKKPPPRKPSDRQGGEERATLHVSTKQRPDFKEPLAAFVFDGRGNLLERTEVKAGKLAVELSPDEVARARVFLAPAAKELEDIEPTPAALERLGAYEPVLRAGLGAGLVEAIEIPGFIIDIWPYCFCFVRGRVVRAGDGRPVCDARVHICEVDRLPTWIRDLPDFEVLKLRDDLIRTIHKPIPLPEPRPPGPGPGPDPAPFMRPLIRLEGPVEERAAPETAVRLETVKAPTLPLELRARLESPSAGIVREALAVNWKLILPYLCLWPWWWRFRCDEVAVRTTDANGRFQAIIPYLCSGDRPDIYFWVEYDLGAGFETVYRPPLACWTYWDYPCGSEVTIRVWDPRVPACNDEPDLNGKQVWVVSVGRTVSIGEIYTDAAGPLEGRVSETIDPPGLADYAFGGKLEPRVWFGRQALIGDGITHYLWSVRPPGGTDADWKPLNRQVIRHYTTGAGTAPVDVMGPEPGGANIGRFRIRPKDPPTGGIEWLVADEREDLASAHFVTHPPAAPETPAPCGVADQNAGKYELKLELFDTAGNLVIWEDQGIALRIATTEAPFGVAPVNTAVAGNYNRIKNAAGKTVAFHMVLHVDNSRSGAEVQAVSGSGITVEPSCGVVTLTGASPTIDAAFKAGRPGGLARFSFATERGLSTDVPEASAAGDVEDPTADGFTRSPPCTFSKAGIPAGTLLGSCDQAAFSQRLHVWALTQDGYSRVGLDAHDVAAFMLTKPCPPAGPPGGGSPGGGRGGGRGSS